VIHTEHINLPLRRKARHLAVADLRDKRNQCKETSQAQDKSDDTVNPLTIPPVAIFDFSAV
jgi:hypothetical protein